MVPSKGRAETEEDKERAAVAARVKRERSIVDGG